MDSSSFPPESKMQNTFYPLSFNNCPFNCLEFFSTHHPSHQPITVRDNGCKISIRSHSPLYIEMFIFSLEFYSQNLTFFFFLPSVFFVVFFLVKASTVASDTGHFFPSSNKKLKKIRTFFIYFSQS